MNPLPCYYWKPIDWSQAPGWASWAAMDATGRWFFYEEEPRDEDGYFTPASPDGRLMEVAHLPYPHHWRLSLIHRPAEAPAKVIPFSFHRHSCATLPA